MRRWMKAVFVMVLVLTIGSFVSGIAVAMGYGMFAVYFPGVPRASAADVVEAARIMTQRIDGQQQTLSEILASQKHANVRDVVRQLEDTRTQMCEAVAATPPNTQAFQFAAYRLRQLRAEYEDLTGREYAVPSCEQLVVTP